MKNRGIYVMETHIDGTGGYLSPLLQLNLCNVSVELLLVLFCNGGVCVFICLSVYRVLCAEQ